MLGLTQAQFTEADLSGEKRTDDQFGAIMSIEELARFGQIPIDGARCDPKRAGDFLVRQAPSCKNDTIPRPWMQARERRCGTWSRDDATSGLECEYTNDLDRPQQLLRSLGREKTRERARSHALPEQRTWYGYAFIESLSGTGAQAIAVVPAKLD